MSVLHRATGRTRNYVYGNKKCFKNTVDSDEPYTYLTGTAHCAELAQVLEVTKRWVSYHRN
jgi:hypothetical protein